MLQRAKGNKIHFYLLGERVPAEEVNAVVADPLCLGDKVRSDQSLVPAATRVADSCPLLDSLRVPSLVLQIQETKDHVPGGDTIVLIGGRDAPHPGGCPFEPP